MLTPGIFSIGIKCVQLGARTPPYYLRCKFIIKSASKWLSNFVDKQLIDICPCWQKCLSTNNLLPDFRVDKSPVDKSPVNNCICRQKSSRQKSCLQKSSRQLYLSTKVLSTFVLSTFVMSTNELSTFVTAPQIFWPFFPSTRHLLCCSTKYLYVKKPGDIFCRSR